jgi:polyphosphate kinase 2
LGKKKKSKKSRKREKKQTTASIKPEAAKAERESVTPLISGQATSLKRKDYENKLQRLQVELVRLQQWVKQNGTRIVVVFEGRDAAGKGGVIKRITERVSPRVFRVVALPAPNERERTQFYFQRYAAHLPAAGEIVLFDRSWYNRAGVERVMGFCSKSEYDEFLRICPNFEDTLVRSGIILIKYFFDVSQQEQERRFLKRIEDPQRQWKLSPMDIESYRRWWDYTKAYDVMISTTDTELAPWYIVSADDKKRARLNCIAHMLQSIPYRKIRVNMPELPKRKRRTANIPDQPAFKRYVPEAY